MAIADDSPDIITGKSEWWSWYVIIFLMTVMLGDGITNRSFSEKAVDPSEKKIAIITLNNAKWSSVEIGWWAVFDLLLKLAENWVWHENIFEFKMHHLFNSHYAAGETRTNPHLWSPAL